MFELLARYSQREKLIVGLALLVLIVIGTHSQVIEPYQQRVVELQDEIEQQRADLKWMQAAVANMPATMDTASVSEIEGTLASFVDQVVRNQGLSGQLSQMSPVGDDELRMRYTAVDFNRLVTFIAQVNASGLEIKDIRVSSDDDTPGLVDCSLVLVRS